MKITKRIISAVLIAVSLFSSIACQEYNPALGNGGIGSGGSGNSSSGGSANAPTLNGDPTDDFTVTVRADGEEFNPRMDISVYWNDGSSVHSAPLNDRGVARIDGLDGDYRVTLSAVPNEYTYNPNVHIATNDERNIVLDLYTLNFLTGSGTGIYDCYKFRSTGVYSAVIEKPGDGIFFEYAPDAPGIYSIESWCDTVADNINPYVDVYIGSSAWKQYSRTTNDGGEVGSYTVNFVHTVQIAKENISAGGQSVYTFAVKADSRDNQYPITITFAVKRDGEFELPGGGTQGKGTTVAIPKFDFSTYNTSDHEYGSEYTFKYPEYQFAGSANTYVFDDAGFKLWKKSDGGDDFYHVYDEEKYPETGGYGPILYAHITSACRFLDKSLHKIEYRNGETINNALTAEGVNYKHFIEGYAFLATYGNVNGGSYYCVPECPCHKTDNVNDWACTKACTECDADCRRIPEELIGHNGYQAFANSDGMVAVTEELRAFLIAFCNKGEYFYDGKGYIDGRSWSGKYYQSPGDSGWLFACGYYEK